MYFINQINNQIFNQSNKIKMENLTQNQIKLVLKITSVFSISGVHSIINYIEINEAEAQAFETLTKILSNQLKK
jgi:hypothetical protein